jgi:hypothetical protein
MARFFLFRLPIDLYPLFWMRVLDSRAPCKTSALVLWHKQRTVQVGKPNAAQH